MGYKDECANARGVGWGTGADVITLGMGAA